VVFCRLRAADVIRLESRLCEIIKLGQENVLSVPFRARCEAGIEVRGRPLEPLDARDIVIIS
jgi:CRISPR/Cas system-associated endoribonuclease Cas2